ncbi:tRNA (adenosine(37)-N6)-threonylcarbamoyltransferase complex transferase subunit TsaD [Candidatus Saccharibacteria bacterium RIFCSPHIGHO2_12_FULL_42_8]|nr:MAG: tRNA (adenosine(37)-N6)-threonylcarbamoyltransferase complex transferase subunit TsaD [Candidatus Saccharibacteria bacterium RIFCSPHIGHO2_12_FULL_42_8]
MKILGIETSCDETAASVVQDGRTLLSNVIKSQIDIHTEYGGVVPEVAARSHIEVMLPVVNKALKDANTNWHEIDAIAVTYAPGLIGSLLVGTLTARTLALIKSKPLYPVHHIKAHVYANFLLEKVPEFPILALIVSGGHSQLVLFRSHTDYEILGQTQDDAVGEAFDKVAKILGLPYPGGPSISKASLSGNPDKYSLPKSKLQNPLDFSFSGLKTAVLRAVQHEVGKDYTFPSHQLAELLTDEQRNDFAASFQKIAVETLVDKTELAYRQHSPASVVIAGGVAANQELRKQLASRLPITINYPPIELCTDNAAMIAALAYYQSQSAQPIDPRKLEIFPSLSI